jgi:hypothetical protein
MKSTDLIGHFQLERDIARTRKIETVEVEERSRFVYLNYIKSHV